MPAGVRRPLRVHLQGGPATHGRAAAFVKTIFYSAVRSMGNIFAYYLSQ